MTPPARVTPTGDASLAGLLTRIAAERAALFASAAARGGVLLRGFAVPDPPAFQAALDALALAPAPYTFGQSQRTPVLGSIYTSTEYAPRLDITLHHELSYLDAPPRWLVFWCERPPDRGGETPFVDGRAVLARLDPAVRARFEARGVTYVKNMADADADGLRRPGGSWQGHFETGDRDAVTDWLTARGVDFSWRGDGGLRTRMTRPAVAPHPDSGEPVWFNQADLWHYTDKGRTGARLLSLFGGDPEALPTHARFGDGGEIDPADLAHVRETAWAAATIEPWRAGDMLLLDNRLAAHGRRAYTGDRRVRVAMGG